MPRSTRLDAVDQMRAVAILLVLAYHLGPLDGRLPVYDAAGWLVVPSLGWRWLTVPVLHFGFTGVHAFFVLSGFCIHLRAARALADGEKKHDRAFFRPRSYFLRRFWRIYPPYWIALAAFGVALPLWRGAGLALADLGAHAAMLHTLDPRTFFSLNPAFWSLATEEQFYLAYPLVLAARRRWGMVPVLGAALGLSLVWRAAALVLLPPTAGNFLAWRVLVHGLFVPRWFDWLLGCWLAERVAHARLPSPRAAAVAGAALLAAGMACRIHVAADKLLADSLYAAGWTGVIGALLGRGAAVARSALGAAMAWMGRRAYGLYLVHQPIVDGTALAWPLRAAVALAAGLGFSLIFERPFEKRAQQVPL